MQRQTVQSILVYNAVRTLGCHASAEEIYRAVSQDYPNISRATVYRNLGQLAKEKKILKIAVPDGADRFDHQCHAHYHIRCTDCDRVFDVDMEYLDHITARIKDDRGFTILGHDILFSGRCPDCKAADTAP